VKPRLRIFSDDETDELEKPKPRKVEIRERKNGKRDRMSGAHVERYGDVLGFAEELAEGVPDSHKPRKRTDRR
jgi:hypothetical protein